jgi:hypothetical protein
MARVAGPDGPGWTCVNCNAAGDPEDDHLEDPADSRPCGCEETEGLRQRIAELESKLDYALKFAGRCETAEARVVELEGQLANQTCCKRCLRD